VGLNLLKQRENQVKVTKIFAIGSAACAALSLFAVAVKLVATDETDWPILLASLLLLLAAATVGRSSSPGKRRPGLPRVEPPQA
jgi:hypothetical protein